MKENITERKKIIKNVRRVVIKAGTRLLTDTSLIPALIKQIAFLKKSGIDVILITSGAVGVGMKTLGMKKRPTKLSEKQAAAAIGQSKLMSIYEHECEKYGFHAAQLLLTAKDLNDRERHLNVLNCINSLWSLNNLPIINENDSVSIAELKLGDNDTLAALVAVLTHSDLTIILTTVNGFHSQKNGKLDKRISVISEITEEMKNSATGSDNSSLSIGGMITKLTAAEIITSAGEAMIIADGRTDDCVLKVFKGEDSGTLFLPVTKKQMRSKHRWLSFFSRSSGKLVIDEGAIKALLKNGRSLLPSGITDLEGTFQRGDTVSICDSNKKIIARGLCNYSSENLIKIIGKHTREIRNILGTGNDEVVHRNNLVLLPK